MPRLPAPGPYKKAIFRSDGRGHNWKTKQRFSPAGDNLAAPIAEKRTNCSRLGRPPSVDSVVIAGDFHFPAGKLMVARRGYRCDLTGGEACASPNDVIAFLSRLPATRWPKRTDQAGLDLVDYRHRSTRVTSWMSNRRSRNSPAAALSHSFPRYAPAVPQGSGGSPTGCTEGVRGIVFERMGAAYTPLPGHPGDEVDATSLSRPAGGSGA
jgi:hypothetical protein